MSLATVLATYPCLRLAVLSFSFSSYRIWTSRQFSRKTDNFKLWWRHFPTPYMCPTPLRDLGDGPVVLNNDFIVPKFSMTSSPGCYLIRPFWNFRWRCVVIPPLHLEIRLLLQCWINKRFFCMQNLKINFKFLVVNHAKMCCFHRMYATTIYLIPINFHAPSIFAPLNFAPLIFAHPYLTHFRAPLIFAHQILLLDFINCVFWADAGCVM